MKIKESKTIPLFADKTARWEQKADLSGKRYGFFISYNTLQDAWFLSIFDSNEKELLKGIRLVPAVFLLQKYRASVPELPQGELWLLDAEGQFAEVTRNNLGAKFFLTYTIFGEE